MSTTNEVGETDSEPISNVCTTIMTEAFRTNVRNKKRQLARNEAALRNSCVEAFRHSKVVRKN